MVAWGLSTETISTMFFEKTRVESFITASVILVCPLLSLPVYVPCKAPSGFKSLDLPFKVKHQCENLMPLHTFALQLLFQVIPLLDHLCLFLFLNWYLLGWELRLLLITAVLLTASQALKYHTVHEHNPAAVKQTWILFVDCFWKGKRKVLGRQTSYFFPNKRTQDHFD